MSSHGVPVGAKAREAGRGRSCLKRETGPSLALLPESRDGQMSPGAPEPLQQESGGPWAEAAADLLPHGPRGRRQERAIPLCSRQTAVSQVMMQEPRVINEAAI